MEYGIDSEKEALQSLVRSCLLELNKLKFDLTQLEVEKANDNSASRIQELEQDIVDKEKEVSVIKFKTEEEVNQLKSQLEEKDLLIKNQEDRIYELDYVNNSLDEIKTYFAEQLKDYKKNELSEVNERLNESYKSMAEKDAQINSLSRTIDDYKIQIIKLENDAGAQQEIMELEKQIEFKNRELQQKDNEITAIDNQLNLLKEQSIPKQDYENLQAQFESEMAAMDNEITLLKERSIPKEDYDNLKKLLENEVASMDSEINALKENSIPREEYVSLQNYLESEISVRESELKYLKEQSVPKADYVNLQNQLQNEITTKDNELKYLKEQTVSREEFINLQNELIRKNDKIKRLEEINTFFNELQEEQDSYETIETTPPFKLEKKQHR
ncbi:glycosyl transferase [Methanobrevibacter sp.]|uniref:glycosyl transferase n=1 Tax=Methanobrevibacter sp. TaxID=66852 RepID=UPI0025EB4EC0|nr:glycosyl transferase [Methanobrevibacter sp.]MEE0024487.1 glycosyl transferase [Methanobrevibacter sp.]